MPLWERIKSIFGFDKTRTQSCEIPNLDVFLYELLGYQPKNIEIYKKAFIHRSAQVKDEHGNDVNFGRLEFLGDRSEEHTSERQSRGHLVCRLLLEKKKQTKHSSTPTTEMRTPST